MKYYIISALVIFGALNIISCAVKEKPLDFPEITGREIPITIEEIEKPEGMPYEVFNRSKYAYKLPYAKDVCDYDPKLCKGYVFAAGDQNCYCIPQKCTKDDAGKETCTEIKP